MHTIKGSAAMMMFDSISTTAHAIEDLFYYLREEGTESVDYRRLTDLVLAAMDFIKEELGKLENNSAVDGDGSSIIAPIKDYLTELKGDTPTQTPVIQAELPLTMVESKTVPGYKAVIFFEEGAEMENIRAYNLLYQLKDVAVNISHTPDDILVEESIVPIRKSGFLIKFDSEKPLSEIRELFDHIIYLRHYTLEEAKEESLNTVRICVKFSPESEMENIRAYALVARLRENFEDVKHEPVDLMQDDSLETLRKSGLKLNISTVKDFDDIKDLLEATPYIREVVLEDESLDAVSNGALSEVEEGSEADTKSEEQAKVDSVPANNEETATKKVEDSTTKRTSAPAVISVNVSKLDQLLNLMGELVIAEAMVTQNPDLDELVLESFHKEARQLRKIIKDLQEIVMSMRMVPLSTTFFKMHRIVRDMCRQLGKDVQLEVVGEETEVDKNIIERISDPLMHIIRNSIDHGIEMPDVRQSSGKDSKGTVILEAKNSGGDVLIIIKDDGAGLDRDKILKKAKNNDLLKKHESEYTDKEIQQFIFLPGFSTNEKVTSFSGRGVGMDVVSTNLEAVGGSVLVESVPEVGSVFTLKIPLTLAIIDGMTVKMGGAKYTVPIVSIKQSFKATQDDIFTDPNGNEMISTRGEIYNVLRLYDFFGVETAIKKIEDGILIMLENGDQTICMLADELVGEQQVVVKSIPKFFKKTRGISGCTLLGNGEISLIIDVAGLFDK